MKKVRKCPKCSHVLEEKQTGEWWCGHCKEWFEMMFGAMVAITAIHLLKPN